MWFQAIAQRDASALKKLLRSDNPARNPWKGLPRDVEILAETFPEKFAVSFWDNFQTAYLYDDLVIAFWGSERHGLLIAASREGADWNIGLPPSVHFKDSGKLARGFIWAPEVR